MASKHSYQISPRANLRVVSDKTTQSHIRILLFYLPTTPLLAHKEDILRQHGLPKPVDRELRTTGPIGP